MKTVFLLFTCICLFSFTGCKKDDESPAELSIAQLKTVISDNGIKRVIPVKDGESGTMEIYGEYGKTYHFGNGVFSISNSGIETSYELSLLSSYRIGELMVYDAVEGNGAKENVMLLSFK